MKTNKFITTETKKSITQLFIQNLKTKPAGGDGWSEGGTDMSAFHFSIFLYQNKHVT